MAKIDKPAPSSTQPSKRSSPKGEKKADGADQPKPEALQGSWRADFEAADKNKDGKVTKSELKLPEAFDADGNRKVTKAEFRAGFRQANSFDGLDRDEDGSLDAAEMKKLRRFDDASFDADADGKVSEQEFVVGKRADNRARHAARRDADYEALGAKEKQKLKRYDADGDGRISRTEFHAGKEQDRQDVITAKIAANYAKAGGEGDTLEARGLYKAYDKDTDGNVTRDEFAAGQRADRAAYWKSELTLGGADKVVARRLDLDALGHGINRLDGRPSSGGPAPAGPTGKGTDLVISSFNVLGSSHTRGPGSDRPGMAAGATRIKWAADLLDKHKVDIVGFQEFQPDQVKAFQKAAGDKYGLYPGMKLGRGPNVNSIAWDKRKWDLVKADTVPIPYFGGKPVKMPFVRLRNKQTGQEVYVANFHNPASTKKHPGNEHWRDVATQKEIELVNRLKRSGVPVFMTGDFNERQEAYNKVTRGANMASADESRNGRAPRNPGIDWIFGTEGVDFSGYVRDDSALVDRTSDHPMIVSHATVRRTP